MIVYLSKSYTMLTAELIEKKNKRKGRNISIIIHLLLLLIAFFYYWSAEKQETYPPPVVVNFEFSESSLSKYAHADAGKSKAKTEAVKKVETTKPKKVVVTKPKVNIPTPKPNVDPTPTDPIVSETTQEEAPIEAVEDEIEIEDPEPDPIPEVEEVEQEVITEEDLEELAEEAMEGEATTEDTSESTASSGTSGSDDTDSVVDGDGGTGEASSGDGDGASSGDDGDEGVGQAGSGTGEYDGSGDGVFGRKIVKRNWRALFKGGNQSSGQGKIAVKICVDRAGDVVFTEILFDETTETDRTKLRRAIDAAKGYKVQSDYSAPEEQCGKLIFNLDINALNGGGF